MSYIVEPERKTPILHTTDVLVAGGGVAGWAAAICAARNGCDVTLIERYGFLGGMATAGLVLTVPPMNNGLQKEMVERLESHEAYKPLTSPVAGGIDALSHSFDPEALKLAAAEMLEEANVKILLHTLVVDTIVRDNAVKGVIVENKSGRNAVLAKTTVDATGDGDVAAYSKAPFEEGDEKGQTLPVTLMFNMTNVEVDKTIAELHTLEALRNIVQKAVDRKQLAFSLGTMPTRNAPGVKARTLIHKGELNIGGGCLYGISGTKTEDLTRAEIVTRKQANILADFLKKNIPGFERSRLQYTATQVGIRETRRILGEYTITIEDLKAHKRFEDTVAKPYLHSEMRVPYRCLLPRGIEFLLIAGRCISGKPEAMDPLRLIPPCIATGQAAGTAAALSVKSNVSPRQLNVPLLQKALISQGVSLGL